MIVFLDSTCRHYAHLQIIFNEDGKGIYRCADGKSVFPQTRYILYTLGSRIRRFII